MNLENLHEIVTRMIANGVPPETPITTTIDGGLWEICMIARCSSNTEYYGDPSPKLSSFKYKQGCSIVFISICEDVPEDCIVYNVE